MVQHATRPLEAFVKGIYPTIALHFDQILFQGYIFGDIIHISSVSLVMKRKRKIHQRITQNKQNFKFRRVAVKKMIIIDPNTLGIHNLDL